MSDEYNDFEDCNAFSHSATVECEFWGEAYRKFFDGYKGSAVVEGECEAQYRGVDRVIALESGKAVKVDEKARSCDYGDILIEYCSNDQTDGNDGWINDDLLIDYLAYGIVPSGKVYMLPWQALRRAWLDHGVEWMKRAKGADSSVEHVKAKNRHYTTLSIALEPEVLLEGVRGALQVDLEQGQQ